MSKVLITKLELHGMNDKFCGFDELLSLTNLGFTWFESYSSRVDTSLKYMKIKFIPLIIPTFKVVSFY